MKISFGGIASMLLKAFRIYRHLGRTCLDCDNKVIRPMVATFSNDIGHLSVLAVTQKLKIAALQPIDLIP
jgi:hypothetical protein